MREFAMTLAARFRRGLPPTFGQNLLWQYVASVGTLGLGLLQWVVIGRVLGPAEAGLMASALAIVSVLFGVVELRLHEATIRYMTEFQAKGDDARTLAVVKTSLVADLTTGMLALATTAAAAVVVSDWLLRDPRGITALVLCALTVFFNNVATATATAILRTFDEFRGYALIRVAGSAAGLAGVATALVGAGLGIVAVMAISAAAAFATNVTLIAFAFVRLNRRIPWRRTHAPIALLAPHRREIQRFVLGSYGLALTTIPARDLDITMLAWFYPLEVVGIYRMAKNFMGALWHLSDPFLFVVYPELSRLWSRGDVSGLRSFLRRLTAGLGAAGLVLGLSSFVIVPIVIDTLLGASFSSAGTIFRWMGWSIVPWMLLLWVNPLLIAAGRPQLSVRAAVSGAIVTVAMALVCVPRWAGNGAALAYSAGVCMTQLDAWRYARALEWPGTNAARVVE
jgi:O-antigen/teichoic acid export membrane protein